MTALSVNKQNIHNLFGNLEAYPSDGKFEISTWFLGKEYRVTVDDYLPGQIKNGAFRPYFAG